MATRGESLTPAGLALGRAAGVRGRPFALAAGGIAALVVALVLGVGFGSVSIDPADTVAILAQRLLGIDLGRDYSAAAETIVMDLRLPRVLTAMLVGLAMRCDAYRAAESESTGAKATPTCLRCSAASARQARSRALRWRERPPPFRGRKHRATDRLTRRDLANLLCRSS